MLLLVIKNVYKMRNKEFVFKYCTVCCTFVRTCTLLCRYAVIIMLRSSVDTLMFLYEDKLLNAKQ